MRCAIAAQAMTPARVWGNDEGSLPGRLPRVAKAFLKSRIRPERERLPSDSLGKLRCIRRMRSTRGF